jgi:tetrapyrrole methylase family protein / MazG family protein
VISIVGLGPGALDRVPSPVRSMLLDPDRRVVARTEHHPAAAELGQLRDVVFCDDLYQSHDGFDDVYEAIAQRVIEVSTAGPVVYAVPGSPLIGEFAVRKIRDRAHGVEVVAGESFVDAILSELAYDPLDRGLQILDGHHLPDPLVLDKPTIVAHLDRPEIFADALDAVARVIAPDAPVVALARLGSPDAEVVAALPGEIDTSLAGLRTSLFVDADATGLIGAVRVMRRLRSECPWDREQTHHSLVKNLIEETHELIDAISQLPEDEIDWVAYASVEDELGDVLLQVLFHEAIAREVGAFDIDGAAGVLVEKLTRRHPHVFGDVEVADSAEVKQNWDRIKEEEGGASESVLDGVPEGLPAVPRAAKIQNRAAKVGFDWSDATEVLPKLHEELAELEGAISGEGDIDHEVGDLLFSVINLTRHLGVDPEVALRRATARFEDRFRRMEEAGSLAGLDLEALDRRWAAAKDELSGDGPGTGHIQW